MHNQQPILTPSGPNESEAPSPVRMICPGVSDDDHQIFQTKPQTIFRTF